MTDKDLAANIKKLNRNNLEAIFMTEFKWATHEKLENTTDEDLQDIVFLILKDK